MSHDPWLCGLWSPEFAPQLTADIGSHSISKYTCFFFFRLVSVLSDWTTGIPAAGIQRGVWWAPTAAN